MFSKIALVALAAAVAEATPQGFNYGSTRGDGSAYMQSDFEGMFKQAQNLPGASGFSSGRLYTMLQGGTTDQIISAIPAAVSTKTSLLLGMWVSGGSGDSAFDTEMSVLKSAVSQYGNQLKGLVDGISVGSEDLYRISPVGLASPNAGPGQSPQNVAKYINQVKSFLAGTPLSGVPVGHVDTWNSWVNGSNSDVINAADFLGVDAYPYWQSTVANDISNGQSLFNEALHNTQGAAGGKPVWITETGWPVKGSTSGAATAGSSNAQSYWQQVGCPNFGSTPTYWYTLEDDVTGSNPDFSIWNAGSNQPYFDLSCANVQTNNTTPSSNENSSNGTSTLTTSAVAATGTGASTTGTGSGSGAGNGTFTSGSPASPSSTGSGSGSSSGTGSGPGSSTGSGPASKSSSASGSVSTGGAATMGAYSVSTLLALVGAVAALL